MFLIETGSTFFKTRTSSLLTSYDPSPAKSPGPSPRQARAGISADRSASLHVLQVPLHLQQPTAGRVFTGPAAWENAHSQTVTTAEACRSTKGELSRKPYGVCTRSIKCAVRTPGKLQMKQHTRKFYRETDEGSRRLVQRRK